MSCRRVPDLPFRYDSKVKGSCDFLPGHPAQGVRSQRRDESASSSLPIRPAASCAHTRWTSREAWRWHEQRGWLVGCNFIPSTAVNQLAMWQAETFDATTIDRELSYAASLGFNSVRTYLHDLLWKEDPHAFKDRISLFLDLAARHGIGAMFVLFDSCWHPVPALGPQPAAIPRVHNSAWVQGPGRDALLNPDGYPHLKDYVTGLLRHFGGDSRVHAWDLWNEPNNLDAGAEFRPHLDPPNKRVLVRGLLSKVYSWARAAAPTQPLTSGVWGVHGWPDLARVKPVERFQLEHSDVISFHCYGTLQLLQMMVEQLSRLDRPVLCTEFLARPFGSQFDPNLGYLRDRGVGAYCWGLVEGETQTIYPWDSWKKTYESEPSEWFHDIFYRNGMPFRTEEVDYIRAITGSRRSHSR